METKTHTIKVINPDSKMFVLLNVLRKRKEEQRKQLRDTKECTFNVVVK